jgi:hypothetical protein
LHRLRNANGATMADYRRALRSPHPARARWRRRILSPVVGAPFAGLVRTSTPPLVSIVSDGRGINRQTAAKAASPQNGADRRLDDAQLGRNLLLRPALFAQRLDLGDQALVDNLRSRNRKASVQHRSTTLIATGWLCQEDPSRSSPDRQGKASKSQIGKGGERQDRP